MKNFFEYSIDNLPSTEEEIIYDLVDGILNNNNKINELKNSLEFNDENGLGLKINNLKQEFTNNILKINQNKKELEEKEKFYEENKIKLNLNIENLNNDFKEIEKKIKNLNNFNVVDIFDLSFDKIEKIISKIKDEDNLKNISIEFNKIDNLKRKLSNNLNEYLIKKNQITEINNMLNEEKIIIENNLLNLISEKESLEEIIKNYLKFCLNDNNNLNINNNKIKKYSENFEIFYYEISIINLINFSQNFSEIFFDFIEKNNLFKNISYEKNINIKICKFELNTLLKNKLINFIKLKQKSKKNLNDFIINLSKEILLKFNINFFNSKKFENFIKINIKLNYLTKIIESSLNFINNSFKQILNENNKKLLEINLIINKLNLEQNEKENKLNEIDEKKNLLINSNANNNSYLNQKEKEYLILNEKSLNILNKKKENEKESNEIILTFNLFKENIINKIDELNNKNISLQNEIEYLNSQNDINILNIQKEIENIKKSIKDKYKMIKIQLTIFKRKHKNNLNLYEKLIDKINNALNLNNNTLISGNFNNDSFSNNTTTINNSNFFDNNNNYNNNSILNTNNLYLKNRKLSHRNILKNNVLLQSVLSGSNSSISIFSPSKINNRYSMGKLNNNNINVSNNFLTRSSSYKYFSPIKSSRNFFYNNSNNNSNNKLVNNILNNNSNLNYNNSNVKNNKNNLFFQINSTKNKLNSLSNSNKKYYNKFNVSNNMKDSTINTLNDKNSTINTLFYLKKQSTIHSLKFSPDKFNNNNEINILLETFPVYFRNINIEDNNNKFDPLNDLENLNNFGFLKGSIKIDSSKKYLLIFLEEILYNKINLNDIKSTILNNQIKYIIQIHQKYKQIVKNYGYIELEEFIKLKDLENIPFDDDNKIKALKNKIFNFSIIYNNNNGNNENNELKIEFLFDSYDNIKIWLNGLNYFIINNKKILS